MAYYSFRVGPYARSIYLDGAKTFEQVAVESPNYDAAITQYAAEKFTRSQIDQALEKGYITETKYAETVALIPAQ